MLVNSISLGSETVVTVQESKYPVRISISIGEVTVEELVAVEEIVAEAKIQA